jgi:anti-sigma B factor antagonist
MSHSAKPFSAAITQKDGRAVLALSGELDMATAPELAQALLPLLDGGSGEVTVDISALSFIDSSGLAVLVSSQRSLQEQGRHLTLRGARPHAMKVFEIAGLLELLNVEASTAESSPRH